MWRNATLLYRDAFTHSSFYTQTLLHRDAFTHRRFYAQKVLHTDTRHFYTQRLLHTDAFTHRHFYTQTLLQANTFTYRHFYTQTHLHCTHRRFCTQKRLHSVFDIKHMMASSSVANVCRHFTSEVSHVWFTASWYRSLLSHLCGKFIIKWNNMCHTRHHGTELFWAIYVRFSIIKWNNMCHTRHHGTELFYIDCVGYSQNKMR